MYIIAKFIFKNIHIKHSIDKRNTHEHLTKQCGYNDPNIASTIVPATSNKNITIFTNKPRFQYQSHINYPISKFVKIPRRHHRRHHVRRETRNSRAGISLEPSLRNIVPSKAERSEPGRRIREAGRSVIKDDGV